MNIYTGNDVPRTVRPEDTFIHHAVAAEDINKVLAQGLDVDIKNALTPTNIPAAKAHQSNDPMAGLFHGNTFHFSGISQFGLMTNRNMTASCNDWNPCCKSLFEMFCKSFSLTWFVETCVCNTSVSLKGIEQQPNSNSETFCYCGLLFFMVSVISFSQHDFLSRQRFDEKEALIT